MTKINRDIEKYKKLKERMQDKLNYSYDFYNMPIVKDNVYYLEVGQGADGDYNGGDSVKYYSYNGFGWNNKDIEKENLEQLKNKFNEINDIKA